MLNSRKLYLYPVIPDVPELISRANELIAPHQTRKTPDTLAIAGYEWQRVRFFNQLADLFAEFGVKIERPPARA